MRRRRKGQAALEFLSTYGWAILIVLVMIGALSYFGIMNPKKYLPDRCVFKTGFECKDFAVIATGDAMDVRFTLQNNLGYAVDVALANTVVKFGNADSDSCALDPAFATDASVGPGEEISIICDFASGAPDVGQPIKTTIEMEYQKTEGVYPQMGYGDLATTVQ